MPGDLLFAWAGTRGVSFGPTIWKGAKGVLNQHIYKITPHTGINKSWLYYALQVVTARIEAKAHGFKSTLLHVHKSEIAGQPVLVPSHLEQERIAETLLTWEHAIENLEMLISARSRHKRGLMQRLLIGKKRWQQRASQEWRQVRLGEVFRERSETYADVLRKQQEPNKNAQAQEIGSELLSITARDGVVRRETLDKRDTSSQDKSSYLRICRGDIGYNTMRMWQGVSGLSELEGIVSPAYTICTPTSEIDGRYASYLFKHLPVVHLFRRYSQGLVDDTLSLKFRNFAQIKIALPPLQEQRRIASLLQTCDRAIRLLEGQLDALKRQKLALMQGLLTRQIYVRLRHQDEDQLTSA